MYFKANMDRPFLPLTLPLTLKHTYHKRTVITTYMHGYSDYFLRYKHWDHSNVWYSQKQL